MSKSETETPPSGFKHVETELWEGIKNPKKNRWKPVNKHKVKSCIFKVFILIPYKEFIIRIKIDMIINMISY